MFEQFVRPGPAAGLVLIIAAALIGCAGPDGERAGPLCRLRAGNGERSAEELKTAVGWFDPDAQFTTGMSAMSNEELLAFAEQVRAARKPAVPFPRKSVLILSSGGVYGAFPAGILCGWTQSGTRPEFDVVTGVSTGAFLSVFAFLGSSTDCELQHFATSLTDEDVFERRRLLPSILSESLADSAPLYKLITSYATDERIRQVAVEHMKGRRLYVGTTDLDVRRAIVWDMGAIACRDTPEDRELFRKILLASGTIPGFFPPVRIPVTVDGVRRVERHVDGGTASSMFFVPPWVPPDRRVTLPPNWLYGSDLYIMVAGKIYPDPVPVKSRTFAIVSNAVSTVLYDQTRSDMHKLFLFSILTGMNYHMVAIPKDLPVPSESTSFKPAELRVLFEAGAELGRSGQKWRDRPPGYVPGEGARYRAGTILTDSGRRSLIGSSDGEGRPILPVPPGK